MQSEAYDDLKVRLEECLVDFERLAKGMGPVHSNAVWCLRKTITAVEQCKKIAAKPPVEEKPTGRPRRWQGCRLVNPLCPDDYCVLPEGHYGSGEGKHQLTTMPAGELMKVSDVMFLGGDKVKTLDDVIKAGAEALQEREGD